MLAFAILPLTATSVTFSLSPGKASAANSIVNSVSPVTGLPSSLSFFSWFILE